MAGEGRSEHLGAIHTLGDFLTKSPAAPLAGRPLEEFADQLGSGPSIEKVMRKHAISKCLDPDAE